MKFFQVLPLCKNYRPCSTMNFGYNQFIFQNICRWLLTSFFFQMIFSFQRIVDWHFEENKLQWWISHKLLVIWLIHSWNWSFCHIRIFSHFSIDGPVQCCPEKAILIQIRYFAWWKGCMSYCIKNRSWNLNEAFSEGCAICKPPAILGS